MRGVPSGATGIRARRMIGMWTLFAVGTVPALTRTVSVFEVPSIGSGEEQPCISEALYFKPVLIFKPKEIKRVLLAEAQHQRLQSAFGLV